MCEHVFVSGILPKESRNAVEELLDTGLSDYEISRRTGVGRATVQRWRRRGLPSRAAVADEVPANWRPADEAAYAYLFGVYLVGEFPRPFIRGLIHSDGSRCLNRFSVELKDGPRQYSYPRYFFTNYSADIRGIFCDACDRIGVRWSQSNWRNISISHRKSVALLDSFVGPKS
jgi:hypothetical protein